MKPKLLFFLDIFSALACIVIATFLTVELGFELGAANRAFFSGIHEYLLLYFSLDVLIRVVISFKRPSALLARGVDSLVFLPLLGTYIESLSFFQSYLAVQVVLLLVLIGRLPHLNRLTQLFRLNPTQIFLFGFALAIFMGSLLLSLPLARVSSAEVHFIDAFFTAASAVCVTGLVTLDIGASFSPFGQGVILTLIQLGGIGMMTFYALVSLVLQRKFSQKETQELQQSFLSQSSGESKSMIRSIIKYTLGFELIGACLLFLIWSGSFESPWKGFAYAVFHSVSAFCNAGFSLFPDSLMGFVDQPMVLMVLGALIVVGGIGFPVMFNLSSYFFYRARTPRLRVQTKISLLITFILLVFGALVIFFGEYNHAFRLLSLDQKLWMSIFHSITTRTAGFHAVDLSLFSFSTIWIIMMLMFIGASPGSTGGGIKTTTFGLLISAFWATIRGKERVELFGRTLAIDNIFKAIAIAMVSALILSAAFYGLLLSESGGFLESLFETISAFGTVGLSLGMTQDLSSYGKLLLIGVMFLGRVGPLTFALALARRRPPANYSYPEERIMLG